MDSNLCCAIAVTSAALSPNMDPSDPACSWRRAWNADSALAPAAAAPDAV
jgi:hypothetical protein